MEPNGEPSTPTGGNPPPSDGAVFETGPKWTAAGWLAAGLAVVGVFYFAQGFSPLRLNLDSVLYLHMAQSAFQGGGYTILGAPTGLPSGYPALLTVLHGLGVATPFVFVAANVVFLFLGLAGFYWLFRRAYGLTVPESLAVAFLTSLSFVAVKNAVLAVPETTYFFVSAAALLCLETARTATHWRWPLLLGAAGLVVEAGWVRTVGYCLIPSLLLAAASPKWELDIPRLAKIKRIYFVLAAAAVFLCGSLWAFCRYGFYCNTLLHLISASVADSGIGAALLKHATWKWSELSEILLNVPASRVPAWLSPAVYAGGALLTVFLVRGVWARSKNFRGADLYFVVYAAVVILWHYKDARFWLPVLPFLFLYILAGLKAFRHARAVRWGARAWISAYCAMGIVAMGYSTYLTFSGSRFADLYGDGTYRESYRAAFFGKAAADATRIGELEYAVLLWYEPRAKKD